MQNIQKVLSDTHNEKFTLAASICGKGEDNSVMFP